MTDSRVNIPAFPLVRSATKLIGIVALVSMLSALVLAGIEKGEMVEVMLSTAGVCLGASLLALLPVNWASKVALDKVAMACLSGIGIRLVLSLAGACLLVYGMGMSMKATGVWTMVWYVLLLAIEVAILARFLNTASVDPTRRADLMES